MDEKLSRRILRSRENQNHGKENIQVESSKRRRLQNKKMELEPKLSIQTATPSTPTENSTTSRPRRHEKEEDYDKKCFEKIGVERNPEFDSESSNEPTEKTRQNKNTLEKIADVVTKSGFLVETLPSETRKEKTQENSKLSDQLLDAGPRKRGRKRDGEKCKQENQTHAEEALKSTSLSDVKPKQRGRRSKPQKNAYNVAASADDKATTLVGKNKPETTTRRTPRRMSEVKTTDGNKKVELSPTLKKNVDRKKTEMSKSVSFAEESPDEPARKRSRVEVRNGNIATAVAAAVDSKPLKGKGNVKKGSTATPPQNGSPKQSNSKDTKKTKKSQIKANNSSNGTNVKNKPSQHSLGHSSEGQKMARKGKVPETKGKKPNHLTPNFLNTSSNVKPSIEDVITPDRDPYSFDDGTVEDLDLNTLRTGSSSNSSDDVPGGKMEQMTKAIAEIKTAMKKGVSTPDGKVKDGKRVKLEVGSKMAKMRAMVAKNPGPAKAALKATRRPLTSTDHSTPFNIATKSHGQTKMLPQFMYLANPKHMPPPGPRPASPAKRTPLQIVDNNTHNESLFGFEAIPTPAKHVIRPMRNDVSNVSMPSPIRKASIGGTGAIENSELSLALGTTMDSVCSVTGKVIKGDGLEFIGQKKKQKPAKGKNTSMGKKPRATKKSQKEDKKGLEKRKKEKAEYEAWCKKQNEHFDKCESFELSVEVESAE